MAELVRRRTLESVSLALLCAVITFWGTAGAAGAAADEVPVITLSVDIQPGDSVYTDYPMYRSTLFPPIVLDTSAGPSGPWPASAEASIARECWDEPGYVCRENHPYTVTESLRFTGTFDPATAMLTGQLDHREETFMPEVNACDGLGQGQLEALHIRTQTGTLSVSWSQAESRFVGTMNGLEEAISTHWDYEPGPAMCQGRHLVTDLQQSQPVLWKIVSPELPSPTALAASTDDTTATAEPASDDGSFPYLALVVGMLVALGVIGAVGVFRGWDLPGRRPRPPSPAQERRDSEAMGRYVLGLDRYPGEGDLDMTEREWEEAGRPTYSITKLDTDDDGTYDKERIVIHRDGVPDEVRVQDIVPPPPPDPVQQAYIDWAADQVTKPD